MVSKYTTSFVNKNYKSLVCELLFLHTNRPHYTIQLQYVSYTGSMTRKHGVYKPTRVKVCTAVE